jgi:hypothetical protein
MMRVLSTILILAGCASVVPLADPAQDATSKSFAAPASKALIYVVRDGGYVSGAYQLFRISLDRDDRGALADGTNYVFTVDPGLHSVSAQGNENQERESALGGLPGGRGSARVGPAPPRTARA